MAWYNWVLNPIRAAANAITGSKQSDWYQDAFPVFGDIAKGIGGVASRFGEGLDNFSDWITDGEGAALISKVWDDLTGKSNVLLQNELNRKMAEEEYSRNLQAIGDTANAYEKAGLNRNLMYSSGNNPVSYSAPQLQAYSGSSKIDTIMNRVGKILQFIPAMYQATAALEGIDQARERTKQSEIKTMAMGMSLLDQGYKLGDTYLSHPFTFDFGQLRGGKRHVYDSEVFPANSSLFVPGYRDSEEQLSNYSDAILKNRFDLLNSIGIKNSLNETLRDWRGYQYGLDRRFGAVGRVVGMASQGIGAVGRVVRDIKSIPTPKNLGRVPRRF